MTNLETLVSVLLDFGPRHDLFDRDSVASIDKENPESGDVVLEFGDIGIVLMDDGSYSVGATVIIPGVRYRRDGSGEPDDCDYVELGQAETLEGAVKLALSKLIEDRFSNRLADERMAQDYEDSLEVEESL